MFVVSFADERGATVRAPFDANWPLQKLSTVTFEDHAALDALDATPAEQKTFDVGR